MSMRFKNRCSKENRWARARAWEKAMRRSPTIWPVAGKPRASGNPSCQVSSPYSTECCTRASVGWTPGRPARRIDSHVKGRPGGRPRTRGSAVLLGCRPFQPEAEILSQINALHLRIATQHVRTSGAENFTVVNNVRAVGDHQCFTDVVIRHQNPDPTPFQLGNDPLQLDHLNRIDACTGLVQQQKFLTDR